MAKFRKVNVVQDGTIELVYEMGDETLDAGIYQVFTHPRMVPCANEGCSGGLFNVEKAYQLAVAEGKTQVDDVLTCRGTEYLGTADKDGTEVNCYRGCPCTLRVKMQIKYSTRQL